MSNYRGWSVVVVIAEDALVGRVPECRVHRGPVPSRCSAPVDNSSLGSPRRGALPWEVRDAASNSVGGGKPFRSAASPVLWDPLYYRVALRITQLFPCVSLAAFLSCKSPTEGEDGGGGALSILPPSEKASSALGFSWWAVVFKVSFVAVWSGKVRTTAEGDLWTRYSFQMQNGLHLFLKRERRICRLRLQVVRHSSEIPLSGLFSVAARGNFHA